MPKVRIESALNDAWGHDRPHLEHVSMMFDHDAMVQHAAPLPKGRITRLCAIRVRG
jgi:hypothetical protein